MKKLTLILAFALMLNVLVSCTSGSGDENPAEPLEPSSDTIAALDLAGAKEWAETNGYTLPGALEAEAYIRFDFATQRLRARYIINFGEDVKDFSFTVNGKTRIDHVDAPDGAASKVRSMREVWGNELMDYTLTLKTPASVAVIEYTTSAEGWLNMIEEHLVIAGVNSAWAMADMSIPVKTIFHLEGMEDYHVLNSGYDPERKLWTYRDYDIFATLVAFKNGSYKKYSEGTFSLYTLNDIELNEYWEGYLKHYKQAINFFESVLGKYKDTYELDFVVLGHGDPGDKYRETLTVMSGLPPFDGDYERLDDVCASTMAFELGRRWFELGSLDSWENWLAWAGIRWSSILYEREVKGVESFEQQVDQFMNLDSSLRTRPIKPPDGSNPDSVNMGAYLFSELYRSRGLETVLEVLKTLAEVMAGGEATTTRFLDALRMKMGDDIPDRIERGLELTDYTGLFD
jgi:hypothetical protein